MRGPDGIRKDHPTKVLCRWLRRGFLICAFEKVVHNDPYEHCGGSFTGKCRTPEVEGIDHALELYLRCVDELPHHFQLHFMHAAQIMGYKHPVPEIRAWWIGTYLSIVKDAHLYPESEEIMDYRLGDREDQWRSSEVVTAK